MTEGIYLPDGTFKSKERIVSDAYRTGTVVQKTPINEPFNFEKWQEVATNRKEERMEQEALPSTIEIEIPTDVPIAIAFLGDTHIGGAYHDYELLGHHVNFIREHPLVYTGMMGDLIDGFFFNPAQHGQIENIKEQTAHARSMLDALNGKMLWALAGDHDTWSERDGAGFYNDFRSRYQCHLLNGATIVKLKIGEVTYDIVTSHRFAGHSMYNNLHPQMRESHFGIRSADLYVAAHTHRKGIAQKYAQDIDGGKLQTYVSTGPYKYSDDYAQKLGYPQQREKELGAVFVTLDPHKKEVVPFWSASGVATSLTPALDESTTKDT